MLRFAGSIMREIKTDYSNDGESLTLNQIARKYGLPRAYVIDMKRTFGWTHDQSIFTAEELLEEDLESQEFRAVETLERQAMNRFQKVEDKEVRKKAKMYDDLVMGLFNPISEALKDLPPLESNIERIVNKPSIIFKPGNRLAVATPFDLHYGKKGWSFHEDEPGYSMKEARDLVLDLSADLIRPASGYGLERIILPLGHDFFHVANWNKTTTNGTPQDMDGNFVEMVLGGSDLMLEMVEMYRRLAPVTVVWVPGNHDRETSLTGLMYLKGRYADISDVDVFVGHEARAYVHWKNNLIGNVHGDGTKRNDLPQIMAAEVREQWGNVRNTMWFTGHRHFEQMTDLMGTQIFQEQSICGSDSWHHRKGYVGSRRALDMYIVHEDAGKIHQDTLPVAPKSVSKSLLISV